MLGKVQKKLGEFSRAESKSAWLYDQWKWRYFHYQHKQQAQLNLALIYINGSGVDRDPALGEQWLRRSAANGNKRAEGLLKAGPPRNQ